MTEEELESTVHTPEIIDNKFVAIVNESGLEQNKAQFLLEQFQDHYKMAAEWAKKAKNIIVTSESQTVNMKMARTGRLFLREKRLEIESARKALKESALKEGKAIDMIANFLKDLIIPTEEHLDRQEHFVEYKKKAEDERILAEAHAKAEKDAEEKEKADAIEMAELRKKQAEHEKVLAQERAKQEAILTEERNKAQIEQDRIRKENESKLAKERAEREKAEAELFAKHQAEAKAEADRLKEIERLKSAGDTEKMQKFYDDLMAIEFPEVVSQEAKRIIFDSKSHIGLAVMMAKKYIQSITQEEI